MRYMCPVCGYPSLTEPPRLPECGGGSEGKWQRTDTPDRYHLRGSIDAAIVETTQDRARGIVLAWHKLGRLHVLPHPLPGEDAPMNSGRLLEDEAEREAFRKKA